MRLGSMPDFRSREEKDFQLNGEGRRVETSMNVTEENLQIFLFVPLFSAISAKKKTRITLEKYLA